MKTHGRFWRLQTCHSRQRCCIRSWRNQMDTWSASFCRTRERFHKTPPPGSPGFQWLCSKPRTHGHLGTHNGQYACFYKYVRYSFQSSELRSFAKVEVAILGSPSLIILMVSVDLKQYWTWTSQSTFSQATALAPNRTENQIQNSFFLLSIIIGTAPQYLADLFQIYVPSSSLRSFRMIELFTSPPSKNKQTKNKRTAWRSCPLLLWCTNQEFSFFRCSSESFPPCLQNYP